MLNSDPIGKDGGATLHQFSPTGETVSYTAQASELWPPQGGSMGRNYLTGRDGDRINAALAAAAYNFSLLLRWLEELLRVLSLILWHALFAAPLHLTSPAKLSSRPTKELVEESGRLPTIGTSAARLIRSPCQDVLTWDPV